MKPWDWWRTVFYLIPAVSLYTVVLGSASVVSTLFDRRGNFGHRCARAWSRLILKTTGVEVTVEGLDRIDRSRSYVFAANHQSIYDIPILFANLPFQLRIIAKQSLGRIPFMGWHLRRTGHVLVDRSKPGAGVVRMMQRLVRAGHSLIVFPEGTRSTDGSVGRFKGGSFVVALQAGLPVVPITVVGSRHVMFRGDLMVRPGRVRVIVHEPIETANVPRDAAREFASTVRDVVASRAA
ncbi:MAG TPA: lysophospholipid acyltransferase family protein [Vicinamibacterales bacterium]|nr:lysophospholipid acyltransferase family protein [Vicinamibacterales bacterium]